MSSVGWSEGARTHFLAMQAEGLKLDEVQKCFAQVHETGPHPFRVDKQLIHSSQLGEQLRDSCQLGVEQKDLSWVSEALRHFFQCCDGILPFPCVLQELL